MELISTTRNIIFSVSPNWVNDWNLIYDPKIEDIRLDFQYPQFCEIITIQYEFSSIPKFEKWSKLYIISQIWDIRLIVSQIWDTRLVF